MKKTMILMICLWLLFLGIGLAYADLNTGLIAHYPFTGNANDTIGGNNGNIYNAILTADRSGTPNNAYYFNGSDAHIELDHNFNLMAMDNVTFSAWIKSEGDGAIFYQGNGGEFYLYVVDGKGEFGCHLTNWVWYSATDTSLLPQDKFVNITGVYYARQKIESLWVNGILVATTNLDNYNIMVGPWENTFYANFGVYHESGHGLRYPFKGTIDDFRIYDRSLTPGEIKKLAFRNLSSAAMLLNLLD